MEQLKWNSQLIGKYRNEKIVLIHPTSDELILTLQEAEDIRFALESALTDAADSRSEFEGKHVDM